VSRATGGIAQPFTLILITAAIAGWVTLNHVLPEFGRAALDAFPFQLLATAVSTAALYLAAMILITQRHDDEMATRREQHARTRHPERAEIGKDHLRSWRNCAATTQTKAMTTTKWQRPWLRPRMLR
jgi:uncharacterized membrane protein